MERALAVLQSLPGDFEMVLIDDGSCDGTAGELDAVAAAESRCRIIRFPVNRGQAAALFRGLQEARGEILLTMDGDGQNDPDDFPALLRRLTGGSADIVCGIRTPRHDSAGRRAMTWLANQVRGRLLRDRLHDAGCQLRVMRGQVVAALQPSPMLQTFLPSMAVAAGFRLAEELVRHHPRRHGTSKYGWRTLWWRPAAEMIRLWFQFRSRRP